MRLPRRAGLLGLGASAAVIASLAVPAGGAVAARTQIASPGPTTLSDVRPASSNLTAGKKLPLDAASVATAKRQLAQQVKAKGDASVGDTKAFLALNDFTGGIYVKSFRLRGLGGHIQVWVADDRAFPSGDCRNTLGLTEVTDRQVDSFVHEFDTNIYPKESRVFSVAPALDGTGAPLADILGLPADYYQVSKAQADDIVVLVDNVRDANYYDPTSPDGQTYIGGFFYSLFNAYLNRNLMTIDAYDWLHRTGANPPDDRADPDYVACSAEIAAAPGREVGTPRPRQYEGTFAHEYQHLLESYEDPDEVSWVNEGLSDWAQTLVGYVNPGLPPSSPRADSHLGCFAGFDGEAFGGPENSLTLWQDQGAPEILCDYGAAYSFMEYLHSHYGTPFMTALHRDNASGLAGLNKVLRQFGAGVSATTTVNRWAAMTALDRAIDTHSGFVGGDRSSFTARTLSQKVNWGTPQAYSTPGAPPNGSDFVRLRSSTGKYLSSDKIGTIEFAGDSSLAPLPVEWTVDASAPTATDADSSCENPPAGGGPKALYAGCGVNLDRAIVREVAVPAGSPKLTFDALWNTEEGWDFGFAQVSTDDGSTWTSLATDDTTSVTDPGAIPAVAANVPGFTGDSGSFRTQTADLSAYAGQTVLLGFRYITDPGVNGAGFWVKNVNVGGTSLPTSLAGWKSLTQVAPVQVSGWSVQLVGYSATGKVYYTPLLLNRSFDGFLAGSVIQQKLGPNTTTVGAIVTFEDPSETVAQQARYTLKVNGMTQPGG